MPTAVITGANRGLGLEFARQYAEDGWRVVAACRDPDSADDLQALDGDIAIQPLDVTDTAQVGALAEKLGGQPVDLLINNAGIFGPRGASVGRTDYEAWTRVFAVNVQGPMRVMEALLGHLRRGERKQVVSITSGLGSIEANDSGGNLIYRSSKACLNAAMRSAAMDLRSDGVTVVVLSPGWVRTDMGGAGANLSPERSVSGMRGVIEKLQPSDTGRFFNYEGDEIPW